MEVDKHWSDKFFGEMEFGGCSTNHAIKYKTVQDLDSSLIEVPFLSYDQTLEDLMKEYLEKT